MDYERLLSQGENIMSKQYVGSSMEGPCLDGAIRLDEIMNALKELKYGKAAGDDRVPIEIFMYAPLELLEAIHRALNLCGMKKVYMIALIDLLCPIYKKGDRTLVQNCRVVSFGNSIAKVFLAVLYSRLREWLEINDKFNEFQKELRKGYCTIDNVFCLDLLVRLKWDEEVNSMYCFFGRRTQLQEVTFSRSWVMALYLCC